MDEARVRTLFQSLLQGEPLEEGELREMLVRHITAAPHDLASAPVTASLFDAYFQLCVRLNKTGPAICTEMDAGLLMAHHYHEAGGDLWQWPRAIPRGCANYPREILVEVALFLGAPLSQDGDTGIGN